MFSEYQILSLDFEQYWETELLKNLLFECIQKHGDFGFITLHLKLFSKKSGDFICEGFGKGIFSEALVAARFEAIENFSCIGQNIQNISFNSSLNQMLNKHKKIYFPRAPVELSKKHLKKIPLPWLTYKNFNSSTDEIFLPACSVNPIYLFYPNPDDHFPYTEIYHHAMSVGLAAATNFYDAILHGLLEIIERDALSFFLVSFFLKHNYVITLVDFDTMPETLTNELKKILLETDEAWVLKLPSHLNVYIYLCLIKTKYGIHKGIAASLNNYTALKKAITESIESYNLPEIELIDEKKLIEASLQITPELLDCANINIFNYDLKKEIFLFEQVLSNSSINLGDSFGQLDALVKNVESHLHKIYYCKLYESTHFQVVHVIITRMEEFSNIIKGTLAPMGDRLSVFINA